MLKTVSAALLALSVAAAPALAATKAKTTATAPVAKTEQTKAPAMKSAKALNANAKMGRHHHKTLRHHAAPKKVSAIKGHATPAVSAAKRG